MSSFGGTQILSYECLNSWHLKVGFVGVFTIHGRTAINYYYSKVNFKKTPKLLNLTFHKIL